MKLPNADAAVVPERKVTEYLLSLTHPEGRSKAAYFMRFGFNRARWQVFAEALKKHANEHDIVETLVTPYGISYTVEGGHYPLRMGAPRWYVSSGSSKPAT